MNAKIAAITALLALALSLAPRVSHAQLSGTGGAAITAPKDGSSFPTNPPSNPETANVEVDGSGTVGFTGAQANQQVTVSLAAVVLDLTDSRTLAQTSGGGPETADMNGNWSQNWSLTSDASFSIGSFKVQSRASISGTSPVFGQDTHLSEPEVGFSVFHAD